MSRSAGRWLALAWLSLAPVVAQPLLDQTFADLPAGAPPPPPWRIDSGTWLADGQGGLVGTDCTSGRYAAAGLAAGEASWQDYTLTVEFRQTAGGVDWRDGLWIGFRATGLDQGYNLTLCGRGAWLHQTVTVDGRRQERLLAQAGTSYRLDQPHRLRIDAIGNDLGVMLDDQPLLAVTVDDALPPIRGGGIVLCPRRHPPAGGRSQAVFQSVRVVPATSLPAPLVAYRAELADREARLPAFLAKQRGRRWPTVRRQVFAFYYPWYGNPWFGKPEWEHWGEVDVARRVIPRSPRWPTLGPYDSQDPVTVEQHVAWAQEAGLDGFISSWMYPGNHTDEAVPLLLDAAARRGFAISLYLEHFGRFDGVRSNGVRFLRYILERYADHPGFLKLDGRPVLFAYQRVLDQVSVPALWAEIVEAVRAETGRDFVLVVDGVEPGNLELFDGAHRYVICAQLAGKTIPQVGEWAAAAYPADVALARRAGKIAVLTVMPGFDNRVISQPGLNLERHDGSLYQTLWEQAIAAAPDWVLVTSWNEWHEGSEIEPSDELGAAYLALTRRFADQFRSGH